MQDAERKLCGIEAIPDPGKKVFRRPVKMIILRPDLLFNQNPTIFDKSTLSLPSAGGYYSLL